MTNHSEAAGRSGDDDISGQGERSGQGGQGNPTPGEGGDEHLRERTAGDDSGAVPVHERPAAFPRHGTADVYGGHGAPTGPCGEQQVTLRTPAELADALPYLLGYRPEDSIVLVAVHDRDGRGRFGGRARLGIPAQADDWAAVAEQLSHGLVTGSERRGARPESLVAFFCQDPRAGESGRDVMERLRPLAQLLRLACGRYDVPVVEALCISDGRFWSYCCPGNGCCPAEGGVMGLPGTSVLAAAATYAGLRVRGSLRELRDRLTPWQTAAAPRQEAALDAADALLLPRILRDGSRGEVAEETLALAGRLLCRLAEAPPASGTHRADLRDDELVSQEEAATLILGLQDRTTRDRAAEWMEGAQAGPALRLWRTLARRCVGSYGEHAAAPLTLAGWVAWSSGDELEAREALAMALAADPDYLFARLLHQACNEGLDPESVRRCLRTARDDRTVPADAGTDGGRERNTQGRTDGSAPSRRRRTRTEPGAAARATRRPPAKAGTRRRASDTPGRSARGGADGNAREGAGDGTGGRARTHGGNGGRAGTGRT
ncbi:DUF4192 domain-containing protein [Streptomyces sp. CRN 30]|uniref:DUF4192 domain-containing protein n=1 Tax=Streptomyces sp. CRN 30 TaxID=3075613 RepID=UPI002A81C89C|nr:DUF4192 domain-containing protein [Streptomyces sp. CRN 30]